jgi:surface protein
MDDLGLLSLNDEGDVITEVKKETPWKKIAIIVGVLLLILILIIILIVLLIHTNDNSDNQNGKNKNEEGGEEGKDIPDDDNSYKGQIICIYDVFSDKRPTEILSKAFTKTTNFDIYINDKKVDYSKEVIFPKYGEIKVTYALIQNINMENMFKDISSLLSVDMVTDKNLKILSMKNAFDNCEKLKEFSIKGFDTTEINSLQNLFYNTKIESLSNFNISTTNVEDMSYLFSNTYLTSIDLSYLSTNKVLNMSHMFAGSSSLTYLNIDNFDTSNVIDMSNMFYGCSSLITINQNLDTSAVTNMSGMFEGCEQLQNNLKHLP